MSTDTLDRAFRPIYEVYAVAVWIFTSIALLITFVVTDAPWKSVIVPFLFCTVMLYRRLNTSWLLLRNRIALSGRALVAITVDELESTMQSGKIWFGWGFVWKKQHTQRLHEVLRLDIDKIKISGWMVTFYEWLTERKLPKPDAIGLYWIDGLEPDNNHQIQIEIPHFEGHLLCFGASRSGKTQAAKLLSGQAILRGDIVIIIDPKPDERPNKIELGEHARRLCARHKRPFFYFNPSKPNLSNRIDMMSSFTRTTQLATRLASIIPSSGMDTFVAFSWDVINAVSDAILLADSRPSIVKIKKYVTMGTEPLVEAALEAYISRQFDDWEARVSPYLDANRKADNPRLAGLLAFYKKVLRETNNSDAVDNIVIQYEHPKEHFAKLIATLKPVLTMLTSGDLGKLLSPDAEDLEDERPIATIERIIQSGGVLYLATDTLSDSTVGNAIAALTMAEIAILAGTEYNHGIFKGKRVSLYIDEASNVLNDQFIEILNKGGGAGISVTAFTQTFADFVDKLGTVAKARKVIGNFNNVMTFRAKDRETQDYITESFGEKPIEQVQTRYSNSSSTDQSIAHFSGGIMKSKTEEMTLALPPDLLGKLPNLQFVGLFAGGDVYKGRIPVIQY